ncbi:uncharacterized protein LOC111392843 [Olea europaea var. sylvestris]|uniref:uncharacterized protein LOC111392843 n=1 Tax=Olea europaea var. sylvestris TaxID=158386 RepID=UPI000C1CE720|nr:uncharacterized protein LOC111392843 [Olea europaea var. sylvestris]
MLVKSLQATEHVSHIDQTFQILRKYNMKLNPLKCTFGVASGQFLGYIVNQRGIEANSVKQGKKFQWISECEEAFEALKKHLGEVPLLSKPQPNESLLLYLAVSDVAVSAVLIREENESSRKLRPYFHAHSIQVLTNFPLKQVMQKIDASGRLLKWAIELSEFDLTFRPKHAIKGHALADFMVEFTKVPEMEAIMEPAEPPTLKLFVDGSSGEAGAGAGIVLESPEGHMLNCTVRFDFKASNNAAEYEANLAGLRLAKEMRVKKLLASSDSQLIVNQVNGNFAAKDGNMLAYLKLVLNIIPHFERFKLTQVPRLENAHADALSKLASSMDSELLNIIPIEHLSKPSTSEGEEVLWIEGTPLWMQPIIAYLKEQTLPASRGEARKLKRRAAHFVLQEDTLYKRGKLDTSKGAWVDELPHVLWAIRTTCWIATAETPFSMTYGAEAMSPVEIGVPSHRRIHFNAISNDEARISELHLLEEKRDTSQMTLAKYHRKMTHFYNSKGGVIYLSNGFSVPSHIS